MAEKKRRARGEGSIRQRPNGSWEARFVVGVDPKTGKDIRKSVYGKTQKEVRKKMTEAIAALDKNDYREPCKMSLGQWLDIWQKECIKKVKPSTAQLYSDQIRLYIRPALGAVKLESLDAHTIQRFYNQLGEERDGKPGLSGKSVRNVHGILHKALQQALKFGYIKANPTTFCELPDKKQDEIQPLDEVQTRAFLKAIEGHRHEQLYKVALYTGMREGEVLGLAWDSVDLDNGIITVKQQLRREQKKDGQYYLTSPKNGKARTIAIPPQAIAALRAQQLRQAEQRLKVKELWEDSGMVFTNDLGGYLSYRTVYDCFKRIVAKIGSPATRFHDLRHTYAVMAIQAGIDIKTTQHNLGHATPEFTLRVYTHVTEKMKRDGANQMGNLIGNLLKESE